ncbi:hypothetical protein Tco_0180377 [Tanacetum coccineum]
MAHMEFYDKHNMVAFLQKPTRSEEFHQIVDFLAGSNIRYALTANPTIFVSRIEYFWQTATIETVNEGEPQLTVTVDGQTFAITEASIMRHLQLVDADEQPSQVPITDPILETTTLSPHLHETTFTQTSPHMPHDSPLPGGNIPGSVEGSMSLNELIDLCTKLLDKVTNLENDLKQTKKLYGKAITKLVKKVKLLEDNLKSTKERRKAKMVLFDDEEGLDIEDAFK